MSQGSLWATFLFFIFMPFPVRPGIGYEEVGRENFIRTHASSPCHIFGKMKRFSVSFPGRNFVSFLLLATLDVVAWLVATSAKMWDVG